MYISGTARIRDKASGDIFEIDARELSRGNFQSDLRGTDPETHHWAHLSHYPLGSLSWYISEHPKGVENSRYTNAGGHFVIRDFVFQLPDKAAEEAADQFVALVRKAVDWFNKKYIGEEKSSIVSKIEDYSQNKASESFNVSEKVLEKFGDSLPLDVIKAAVSQIEANRTFGWAEAAEKIHKTEHSGNNQHLLDEWGIPKPAPGIAFSVGPENLIFPTSTGKVTDECLIVYEPLIEEIRTTANLLINALEGSNAHQDLYRVAVWYFENASNRHLSIDRIYAAGIRLENARAALEQASRIADAPPLDPNCSELLRSTIAMHQSFIGSTQRGLTLLEGARNFALNESDPEHLKRAARDFALAVSATPGLFDTTVALELSAVNEEIGAGPSPERSTEIACTANNNLLITLFQFAAKASATGIIGAGAIAAANAGSALAIAFLAAHAHTILELAAAAGLQWVLGALRNILKG